MAGPARDDRYDSMKAGEVLQSNRGLVIKIHRVLPDVQIPEYAHPDDSGADIRAADDYVVQPLQRVAVRTGLKIEVPRGFEVQIRPRSGLAIQHGITVLNTPGTVDAGYRGEIYVILMNLGSEPFEIKKGDRIAQMIVAPVVQARFVEVEAQELSTSERGEGRHGSSGSR